SRSGAAEGEVVGFQGASEGADRLGTDAVEAEEVLLGDVGELLEAGVAGLGQRALGGGADAAGKVGHHGARSSSVWPAWTSGVGRPLSRWMPATTGRGSRSGAIRSAMLHSVSPGATTTWAGADAGTGAVSRSEPARDTTPTSVSAAMSTVAAAVTRRPRRVSRRCPGAGRTTRAPTGRETTGRVRSDGSSTRAAPAGRWYARWSGVSSTTARGWTPAGPGAERRPGITAPLPPGPRKAGSAGTCCRRAARPRRLDERDHPGGRAVDDHPQAARPGPAGEHRRQLRSDGHRKPP